MPPFPSPEWNGPERSELAKQIPEATKLFFALDCFEARKDSDLSPDSYRDPYVTMQKKFCA